jgi:hypothetical protein
MNMNAIELVGYVLHEDFKEGINNSTASFSLAMQFQTDINETRLSSKARNSRKKKFPPVPRLPS